MRIFLDANILFSAAISDGAIRRLLTDLQKIGHECVADGYVISEARRNLETKYSNAVGGLDQLLKSIKVVGQPMISFASADLLILPEKDRPVLAAAIHYQCSILLTGDRQHFGDIYGKTINGVSIHSPQSIAKNLLET